jgi:hypothetical protein
MTERPMRRPKAYLLPPATAFGQKETRGRTLQRAIEAQPGLLAEQIIRLHCEGGTLT